MKTISRSTYILLSIAILAAAAVSAAPQLQKDSRAARNRAPSQNNSPAKATLQNPGYPSQLSNDEQCKDGNCNNNNKKKNNNNLVVKKKKPTVQQQATPSTPKQKQIPTAKKLSYTEQLASTKPQPYEELHTHLQSFVDHPSQSIYKHIERSSINIQYPTALSTTLKLMGNYTDGTKAGTPQWVGDLNAQSYDTPDYTNLGSVLDLSTSIPTLGQTNDGPPPPGTSNTLHWIASLVHRRKMVLTNREYDVLAKECRIDLLNDDDYCYNRGDCCLRGVTLDSFVSVRATDELSNKQMILAKEYDISNIGKFYTVPNILDIKESYFEGEKFDTIIANDLLFGANTDEDVNFIGMHDMDIVLGKVLQFLKPGGMLYLVGKEPLKEQINEDFEEEISLIYRDTMNVLDTVKLYYGEPPTRDYTAKWAHRTVDRLGLNIYSSTVYPSYRTYEDIFGLVETAKEWIQDMPASDGMKGSMYAILLELLDSAEELNGNQEFDTPVFPSGNDYIIVAQMPTSDADALFPTLQVEGPSEYVEREQYDKDYSPKVEELAKPKLAPGEMKLYEWANGDAYDGASAVIGIPPQLIPTLTDYVKGLGIWDIMGDTIKNDPMPPDSVRFYNVTSPLGDGDRTFTWSAKRPDNFYGSDSDMHWFDVADEASHEDGLRALAKGGFDEVLNAIGTFLGLDNLVSFSIGLLAVTKSEKGYIHVDFAGSGKKAFNFLIPLQSPSDHPELTVIEEDDLGNRRRGQVKYAPEFGVLNGDDAMHATNECNHRTIDSVRITVSIFLVQMEEASLEQVAEHDKYYFPFGNMDWIWAQRGRHWQAGDSSVSLVNDKGRRPFEPKDEMENCEERVGENKEKCFVHGKERMLCYKTCGTFTPDDKYKLGEQRHKVVGW